MNGRDRALLERCLQDSDPRQVMAAVVNFWRLDLAFFPVPRNPDEVRCPSCHLDDWKVRAANFHQRPESVIPWRCDLSFKCLVCSYAWTYGIPVTEDMWDRAAELKGRDTRNTSARMMFTRRDLRDVLAVPEGPEPVPPPEGSP